MRKLVLLLLGVALAAVAAQVPTRPAVRTGGNAPAAASAGGDAKFTAIPIARVKLADGTVLTNVLLTAYIGNSAVLSWTEGKGASAKTLSRAVPVSELPPEYRPAQPVKSATVTVTGGYVEPETPSDPSAPLAAPKQIFAGRIALKGADGKTVPLAGVLVLAVRPAEFAAYNKARLAQHGAEIDAAQARMLAATTPRERATAAGDALFAVYNSFGAPPSPVATAKTLENGSFRLECEDGPGAGDEAVIVARARQPAGSGFIYYVWTVPAGAGGRILLDESNIVSR
jgi:hypothetical protein